MSVRAPDYIPEGLRDIWLNAFIEAGGLAAGSNAISYALETTRNDPTYETYFPGIKRDDGTFRLSERDYYLRTLEYQDTLMDYGVDPSAFAGRFGDLIAGEVDVREFTQRLDTAYASIITQAPEVAQWYEANYGLSGLEPEDIFAAFIDPDVGTQVLADQARVSLVGGAARQQGFEVAATFADAVLDQGVSSFEEAAQFFGEARQQVPILDVLAKRHNDPDDDFDLYEFTNASLFNDPTERRRLARLITQERASFSNMGTVSSDGRRFTGLTRS
jgi:hypothetical protein